MKSNSTAKFVFESVGEGVDRRDTLWPKLPRGAEKLEDKRD